MPSTQQIITNPMDLNLMEKKVKSERYPNMAAFLSDMQLIRDNTYTFNTGKYIYRNILLHYFYRVIFGLTLVASQVRLARTFVI